MESIKKILKEAPLFSPVRPKRSAKTLHSRAHVLADDLSRLMDEPRRFGAYLGISIRYDEQELRALAHRVLEKKDLPVAARGKYFFASLANLKPKQSIKSKKRTSVKKHGKVIANRKKSKKNTA